MARILRLAVWAAGVLGAIQLIAVCYRHQGASYKASIATYLVLVILAIWILAEPRHGSGTGRHSARAVRPEVPEEREGVQR